MSTRQVIEVLSGRATSDGDGVSLLRVFGGHQPQRFDPFLLLDEFGSDQASDYIGGFPAHPHRGFETITYMLQGKMEHRDHMDNVGLLSDGGVQWMTAGKGVIHSEMPKQTEGMMRGFQLWLNLPSHTKLQASRYEDVAPEAIPTFTDDAVFIKALAGKAQINKHMVNGYFEVADTHAVYFDIHLKAGKSVEISVEDHLNTLIYSYQGQVSIGSEQSLLSQQQLARMSDKGLLTVHNNSNEEARLLVLAGKPLKQPIAQYGPFVMNTPAEIEQAIDDYRNGKLID